MEKINISPNESKVLRILYGNSRLSIEQISRIANLNRNTVRKIIRDLEKNGIIKRYTVELSGINRGKYFMIKTDEPSLIPESAVLAKMALANGKYVFVCSQDILKHEIKYNEMDIISEIEFRNSISNLVKVYCDYCGKEITEDPIEVVLKNHIYYACCHNCERDLMRKLEIKA